jgi:hypothetical protein
MGAMGLNVAGTYKSVAKDKIKIELGGLLGGLAGPMVVTASVAGDELTWTMSDGKTSKYRRVK